MSTEEFKVQLASVMDRAVAEAAKLFGTMVEELRAEITRIKEENEVLKAGVLSAEKTKGIACDLNTSKTAEPGPSPGSTAIHKRDVGIQCALPLLRGPGWFGGPTRRTGGGEEDEEDDGAQMAFILIKQEEPDNNDEYAPGYILLKQEDGLPTLIRRPNLREVPALLPSSLRALVSRNAPERPQKQPSSARAGPHLQRAPVSREAPLTPDPVRSREHQEEALGAEAPRTPISSRSREPSPGREQQQEEAPGAEQHPGAAEPERREQPPAEQQQPPSAVAEQQQLTEVAPRLSRVAEQPPTVTSPGRQQKQQQKPPAVAPVPFGIEQLLAVAEEQLKRQRQQKIPAVKHPVQPSPGPQHLPAPTPSGFAQLLPVEQQQQQQQQTPVLETVTVSCQLSTAASKQPPSVHPVLPSDLLPTVPDGPLLPASVSLRSSAEVSTSETPRPDLALASPRPSKDPPGEPAVSSRQQAMVICQTTIGSPRQPAVVSGQATVVSPRQQTIVTDQTIVGYVKKQGVAMAKTVVDSLRQQAILTSQTNQTTTGSPKQQQLPSHVIVVSPRYQSMVTNQTAVALTQQQTSVIPQISAMLPKQLPGVPHRIIVVSPRHQSLVAGQTTTILPRQQQPAVPAVLSARPPPESERSAVTTATAAPVAAALPTHSQARTSAAPPPAPEKVSLLSLSALVPAETTPDMPSSQLFLGQLNVPPDAEPDPLQVDSKDVDRPYPLPIASTETMETRTVATETSPGDTKEGLRAPSDGDTKELVVAHLRARLRPRPHPSAAEMAPSHSPAGPKKPRMSNQVTKSNQSVNWLDLARTPAMTTRGRSTAQAQRALSPQTQTPTSPPRSPLNSSPCSSTTPAQAPSTTNCPRSSLKQPPPTATPHFATGIKTSPAHQEHAFPQQQQQHQDAAESPFQPLQRIGNRLLKNQCGACGRILSSTAALETHVSVHTGERPFSCMLCGKNFADSKGLNRHARVHRGESHPCPQCGKAFTYRFGLTKHLQMVHGHLRPFVCHVCEKSFFTRRDVDAHVMIHTGEKPFHCTQCEKSFKRRVELNVHLRWHNGEKRHWCDYCGKGFLDYNNLKRHKLIHTGEKPHQCPQCNKCFTQSGHLKKHLKNVHKVR